MEKTAKPVISRYLFLHFSSTILLSIYGIVMAKYVLSVSKNVIDMYLGNTVRTIVTVESCLYLNKSPSVQCTASLIITPQNIIKLILLKKLTFVNKYFLFIPLVLLYTSHNRIYNTQYC